MRSARFALLFSVLFLNAPVWPRQAPATSTPSQDATSKQAYSVSNPPPVTKDTQAVDVATQALAAVGGITALNTIADYTATGNMTYHMDVDRDVQGSVTVRGRGVDQLRLDTNLPSGTRSESTSGITTIKNEDGTVHQMYGQPPMAPARMVLPCLELLMALKSTQSLSLVYKGIVEVDGHSAHDVQVRHVLAEVLPSKASYVTVDFFIDSSTFQIVMMQDVVAQNLVRQFRYSNFKVVNGLSMALSISARINDQDVWLLGLSGVNFNLGLQDSDFEL
jgi:hypothetical protein